MQRIDSLKYDELLKIQKDYSKGYKIDYNIDDVDEMIAQIELEKY